MAILIEIVSVRPTCCAEVESSVGRKDWHECGRPAKAFSDRAINGGQYRLYYCDRHFQKARVADLPSIEVLRAGIVVLE